MPPALASRLHRALYQVLRAGFRALPLRTATRDRLRQQFLNRHADFIPRGSRGQLADRQYMRRPLRISGGRAVGYREHRIEPLPTSLPATLVAFYLPQFHAIPENDTWWGEGFTEWRNVARALPQFEGHAQPRLPGSLGFYDLSQPEAMRRQMQLAREYGVGAFCSYFYWFAGKTLLERPLRNWLDDSALDLPICLCWANENWSRRWDGRADEVLIAQRHSPEDDLAFIAHIAPYLRDPRYLRIGGKPLLLIYRPGLLPDPAATARRWRQWCAVHDIGDIHIAYVQSFDNVDPRDIGFDSAVAFPPNNTRLTPITAQQRLINPDFHGDVFDWRELAREAMTRPDPPYPLYPCVNPGWDNEPRRSGAGRVFTHASPRRYRDWLRHAVAIARRRFAREPMVFINAWNEWAEGAVLEPDASLGYAWLEATRTALVPAPPVDRRPCAVIHAWYVEVLDQILTTLSASGVDWRLLVTTAPERESAVRQRLAAAGWQAQVEVFENRGRDILPFLHVASRLLDEGVQSVLKLHTKRSTHRDNGDRWRNELVGRLLSQARAAKLLEAFAADPRLGLIAPEGHQLPIRDYLGANHQALASLISHLDLPPASIEGTFTAGSMFMIRLEALRPLLDAHLPCWLFDEESGQVDGTAAHVIERLLSETVIHAGYTVRDAASVCGQSPPPSAPQYGYARRG